LIATHNPGKFKILKDKLSSLGIEILSLNDLDIKDDFEEIGNSFEDIALGKARFYYNLSKIPTLADDSGLSVDALNGEPGTNSRTWLGYRASDEELLEMLLDRLRGVVDKERTATFVTVVALVNGNEELLGRGEVRGKIGHQAVCKIEPGLPYSTVFYPDGYDRVSAQLSPEEKNIISHRAKALDQIIKKLK